MRLLVITAAAILLTGSTSGLRAQTSSELTGAVQYFIPSQDDDYDSGVGAEAQIQFWRSPHIGFALAGGIAEWDINDQTSVVSDGFLAIQLTLDGSVTLIPIGASLLFRPTATGNLNLVLEGGLRYVIVDSDAEATVAGPSSQGGVLSVSEDIEIDDAVVALFAATLEAQVSSGVKLLASAGYQFDVGGGDSEWMGEDIGENELEAAFIRAGISVSF